MYTNTTFILVWYRGHGQCPLYVTHDDTFSVYRHHADEFMDAEDAERARQYFISHRNGGLRYNNLKIEEYVAEA